MKQLSISIFLILFFPISLCFSQSHFVFGVKPGTIINSAYFGIQKSKIIPFFGADIIWLSASAEYSDSDESYYNYGTTTNEWKYIETGNYSGHAFLFIPHVGTKFLFGNKDVKPYFWCDVFFSIPSVNAESDWKRESWSYQDGQLTDHDIEKGSDGVDEKTKDAIKDALSFWGLSFGSGAEYFFSPNFSIGGEYGLRLIFNPVEYEEKDEDSDTGYDYTYRYIEKWQGEASIALKITYATVSINFYF